MDTAVPLAVGGVLAGIAWVATGSPGGLPDGGDGQARPGSAATRAPQALHIVSGPATSASPAPGADGVPDSRTDRGQQARTVDRASTDADAGGGVPATSTGRIGRGRDTGDGSTAPARQRENRDGTDRGSDQPRRGSGSSPTASPPPDEPAGPGPAPLPLPLPTPSLSLPPLLTTSLPALP